MEEERKTYSSTLKGHQEKKLKVYVWSGLSKLDLQSEGCGREEEEEQGDLGGIRVPGKGVGRVWRAESHWDLPKCCYS